MAPTEIPPVEQKSIILAIVERPMTMEALPTIAALRAATPAGAVVTEYEDYISKARARGEANLTARKKEDEDHFGEFHRVMADFEVKCEEFQNAWLTANPVPIWTKTPIDDKEAREKAHKEWEEAMETHHKKYEKEVSPVVESMRQEAWKFWPGPLVRK